jgi:hypothetical protein
MAVRPLNLGPCSNRTLPMSGTGVFRQDYAPVPPPFQGAGLLAAAGAAGDAVVVLNAANDWRAMTVIRPIIKAHLATARPRATSLLASAAEHAIVVGTASVTGCVSHAGNHRAVSTLELDRAGRKEQGLGSADRRGATAGRGHHRGDRAFGLCPSYLCEAGTGEDGEDTTGGDSEEGLRSHGGLLAKEASKYRAGQQRPDRPALSQFYH